MALASVSLGTTIGLAWAITTGYIGGMVDLLSERVVEVMMAIPSLILALLLVLALGATVWTVIVAIALTRVPSTVRVVRSVVLSVKETPYVEAARAIGAGRLRVMAFHVAPQTVATYIVLVTHKPGHGHAYRGSAELHSVSASPRPPLHGAACWVRRRLCTPLTGGWSSTPGSSYLSQSWRSTLTRRRRTRRA